MQRTERGASAFSCSGGTLRDLGIIALLWALAILTVQPMGDFPLNDDWSYGMTAKRLVEGLGYDPG